MCFLLPAPNALFCLNSSLTFDLMTVDDFVHKFQNFEWLGYTLLALIILVVAFITARLLSYTISKFFQSSAAKLNLDPTAFYFTKNAVSFVVYLMAFIIIFYSIPELKSIGVALFASAGILAAILGFASQAAFSNIISGIMIVVFKPFRVNDMVQIGSNMGIVEDITLRHTVIRNFENRRLVIPNSVISSDVILNSDLTDEKLKMHYEIGISYDSDHRLAMKLLQHTAQEHPLTIDNRTAEEKKREVPLVEVRIVRMEESSVILRAWIWSLHHEHSFLLRCDLNLLVKEAFANNGIEIPYPHRTIVQKTVSK